MFYKKSVLKNSQNSLENTCARASFFSLRPATLLKKRLWHRCFHVNFVKFLKTLFFIEHLWWLLLFTLLYVNSSRSIDSILFIAVTVFDNNSQIQPILLSKKGTPFGNLKQSDIHFTKEYICASDTQANIQNPVKYLRWRLFLKRVNGYKPLTIFAKRFIVDICQGSGYAYSSLKK